MSTIEDLERRIDALEEKPARIERAEKDILEAARQWARVTKLGYYVEGNVHELLHPRDVDTFAKMFLDQILNKAERLLRAETS